MTTATKKTLQDVAKILEDAGWAESGNPTGGNGPVDQTLANVASIIQERATGERKTLLEKLTHDVQHLIEERPNESPQITENLEILIKQATSEKPNYKWYSLSAEGLLEAAKWAKDSSGIAPTVLALGKGLWPNYQLPA